MLKALQSKLIRRYTLYFMLTFFVMGICYFLISFSLANHYLQQVQTKIHLKVADTLIEDHQLVQQGKLNQQAVTDTFKRYMLLNPLLEIYLVDEHGHILKYSADAKKIKRQQINLKPVRTFLTNQQITEFPLGDDPRHMSGQKPFSVALLPNGYYLYVIIQSSIEQEANRQLQESILLRVSAWSFIASLIIGVLLGGLLFLHLTKRIANLSSEVTSFKLNPNKSITKPSHINDDLDELSHAVSDMSQQLQQQLQKLSESDKQRRFMISSLSHDLRTPLTSLLGYIEQSKQNKEDLNLEIAYQNGLKLKRYLDQLFDMSKLDMESFKLHKQEMSLSEFCFDVFQQYQLNHPEREWKIVIQNNYLYQFDACHLERAVCNLLDNAIKHGQGAISLSLKKQQQRLIISIGDYGPFIQSQDSFSSIELFSELCHIGDKPYNQKNGSGLGLAIVKSIVEKHNGELAYIREKHQNCFVISLPLEESKTEKISSL
ncbi:MAG: HAMP domain-containing sensor histidine kinase [Pseudomonadota bacterium]|nr:HAMP domain-containing sensor histidine kinase [Pseudomonadota bacterium]